MTPPPGARWGATSHAPAVQARSSSIATANGGEGLAVTGAPGLCVVLDGPIGVGKTSVGRLLSTLLSDCLFVDGDDFGPRDAGWRQRLPFVFEGLGEAAADAAARGQTLVAAFPVHPEYVGQLRQGLLRREIALRIIGLGAAVETIFAPQRGRRFSSAEVERSRAMIAEGYGRWPFSDLLIATDSRPLREVAEEAAAQIVRWR